MEVEMIPVAMALGSVCIAVYKDLKDRTIPNKLTYPLIAVGIAFYLLLGGYHWDLYLALSGGIGAGIAFGIGYLLYITGAWAGGDVKLFTALGALLPKFEAPSISILLSADHPLFPVTLLLNSLILAVPVLLLYAVISRLRGGGAFYEEIKLSELEEGTIPAETIYEKDGQIGRYSGSLGFLSELIAPEWDRKFTDPRRAARHERPSENPIQVRSGGTDRRQDPNQEGRAIRSSHRSWHLRWNLLRRNLLAHNTMDGRRVRPYEVSQD